MLTHSNPAPHPTPHLDSTPLRLTFASGDSRGRDRRAVPFGSVRLAEKELDASRDEPARLLEVCLRVAERLMRERSGTSPMDKYRLRSVPPRRRGGACADLHSSPRALDAIGSSALARLLSCRGGRGCATPPLHDACASAEGGGHTLLQPIPSRTCTLTPTLTLTLSRGRPPSA